MSIVNSKQSAFPSWDKTEDGKPIFHPGVTKREYFAAMAMQGILSKESLYSIGTGPSSVAEDSARCADALLKELDK